MHWRKKTESFDSFQRALLVTFRLLGIVLFALIVVSVSGCCHLCEPLVIRQACDPPALPPPALLQPPPNLDSIPDEMRPERFRSSNVKSSPTKE